MIDRKDKFFTEICYAFDDPSLSSSKKQKLGLGSFLNKEVLKEKGFKWDMDARLWYRACDSDIQKELTPIGIKFERGLLEFVDIFWDGAPKKVGEGIKIVSESHYKPDAVVQFMWNDDHGKVIRLIGDESMCDSHLESASETSEKINKMKKRVSDNPKDQFAEQRIKDLNFKLEKEQEVIDFFKCK